LSVQVLPETFESLDQSWRRLSRESPMASVFSTPSWQRVWWDACRSSEELLLFSFQDEGATTGVAPLMRSGDTITFIGTSDLCDYHDFLLPDEDQTRYHTALIEAIEPIAWQTMRLEGLVDGSPTLRTLAEVARSKGYQVEQLPDEVSPGIELPASWNEHLDSLGGKDRHELRRKLRRLGAAGDIAIKDEAGSPDLEQQLAVFLRLMRSSRDDKDRFMTPLREAFFHKLSGVMAAEGLLRLFFLELDSVQVASALCFDFNGGYYLYNAGYDTRYASLSVGLLLKTLMLQQAIEEGRIRFSFLRGNEQYKYDMGARDVQLYTLVIRRFQ
jgi:CelD/BcsL family acetyltransferase involved in cellulose biosynthesis